MADTQYTVYMHTCPNGKVYIGITGGSPLARWRGGYGYYKNKHFYSAILKYGWKNIKHDILYEGLTKEQAEQKEIELIALYKSNQREYGYNIDNGGSTNGKHSADTLRKMSESQKGRIVQEATRAKMHKPHPTMQGEQNPLYGKPSARRKIIVQYDLQGNYIKKWEYIKQASIETGVDIGGIIRACNGKQKQAGGYKWRYDGNTKNLVEPTETQYHQTPIWQYSKKYELLNTFNSIKEASEKLGICAANICKCCKGKVKTAGGYVFKYKE